MIGILAAEGPNGIWLPADIKEFAWSAAAFGIVALLLITKVLPLIRKGLSDRSERIRDELVESCLLYTSPSPRDRTRSRMPSSA